MGLFDFFDSNSQSKRLMQESIFKLSKGLSQIDEELMQNNNQVTPFIRGVMYPMSEESRKLYNLISPNGRTNWTLANMKVRDHNGKEIIVSLFCHILYNRGIELYKLTGINIAFSI